MLHTEKVIGRVLATQSTTQSDAKLDNLMVTHFKWQRGRKLGNVDHSHGCGLIVSLIQVKEDLVKSMNVET